MEGARVEAGQTAEGLQTSHSSPGHCHHVAVFEGQDAGIVQIHATGEATDLEGPHHFQDGMQRQVSHQRPQLQVGLQPHLLADQDQAQAQAELTAALPNVDNGRVAVVHRGEVGLVVHQHDDAAAGST